MKNIILFLLLAPFSIVAQNDISRKPSLKVLTVPQLKEDFTIFRNALEEAHPGLYSYTSKDTFDTRFNKTFASINRDMNELELLRLLSPLVSTIGCEHTPIRSSILYWKTFGEKSLYFPFHLGILSSIAFVTSNISNDSTLQVGLDVLSINDIPMPEIINKICSSLSQTDGFIKTGKYRRIESDFPYYYSIYVGQPDSFKINFGDKGVQRILKMPALDIPTIRKNNWHRHPKSSNPDVYKPLTLRLYKDSSTAYLEINSFDEGDLQEGKQHFKRFIKSAFEQIKQHHINNIIIDVRSNSGGNERFAQYLYTFLANSPFRYYKSLPVKTNKKPSFWKYTDKPLLAHLAKLYIKQTDSVYYIVRKADFRLYKPVTNGFKGNVYILVNGGSASAATEFPAFAQSDGRAIIVGEETNGAYMGGNSGEGITLTLPNSGIRVTIPYAKVNMNVKPHEKGRGVIPDVVIERKKESILQHKDDALETTFNLILVNSKK